jgi:DNA polymerase-1
MQRKPRLALDFETFLFHEGNIAPKPVCLSWAMEDPDNLGTVAASGVQGNDDLFAMGAMLQQAFEDDDFEIICQGTRFDLSIVHEHFPVLRTAMYDALEDDRITDTELREKLLNLAEFGKLRFLDAPESEWDDPDNPPKGQPILYNLAALVMKYEQIDITEAKTDEYAWRTNFDALDGIPADEYPEEAYEYAIGDAQHLIVVAHAQDMREYSNGAPAAFPTQYFQTYASFALALMTGTGMRIDPEMRDKIIAKIKRELTPDKIQLLVDKGIVIPAQPERPYENGAIHRKGPLAGQPKMKMATKEKGSAKKLQEHIANLCAAHRIECDVSDKTGKPSTTKAFLSRLAAQTHDPTVEQWLFRQGYQKLITTYLPQQLRLDALGNRTDEVAEIVHANFNVLVETGRTSSFAGNAYPSFQGQNQHPEIRPCFLAPTPGWWLLSVDYSALELVSLAQKCYDLFGYSVLRDQINAGRDVHSFLGTALARTLNTDFGGAVAGLDALEEYEVFMALKTGAPVEQAFHKHWRKFAKPTGLGYPGGLGPYTFVEYAYGTYEVKTTVEEARQLKQVWLETYPEMVEYFRHISTNMEDPRFRDRYAYRSSMGMTRSNATYCATCNGNGMQTPSAEGAKKAVIQLTRETYDPSMNAVLGGHYRPLLFIHDEVVGEVHPEQVDVVARQVSDIMTREMQAHFPDVLVRVEAAAMERWYKQAEPVYGPDGKLTVWTPDEGE